MSDARGGSDSDDRTEEERARAQRASEEAREDGAEAAEESSRDRRRWKHDAMRAATGGVVTLVLAASTGLTVGFVHAWTAKKLVEAVAGVLPYFGSAAMGGGLTILALMLTLLGLVQSARAKFAVTFYRRIVWIGRQACAMFGGAALLLLTMALPVDRVSDHGEALYVAQFYAIAGVLAVLGGVLVSTMMMLQSTLEDLVRVVGIGDDDHPLVLQMGDDD